MDCPLFSLQRAKTVRFQTDIDIEKLSITGTYTANVETLSTKNIESFDVSSSRAPFLHQVRLQKSSRL
jgi:hypothetical protein